jgi:hypothetical protein
VILLALEGEKEILPLQSEDIHKPIATHSSHAQYKKDMLSKVA